MILKKKIRENTIRKEEDFEGLLRSIRETQVKDENLFEYQRDLRLLKERRRGVNVATEIQTMSLSKGEKRTEANGKYKRCPIAENETNNCYYRPMRVDELPTMSEGNGNSNVLLTEIARAFTFGNFKRSLPQNTLNWSQLDLYDSYIEYYAELRRKTIKGDCNIKVQEEADDNQRAISETTLIERDDYSTDYMKKFPSPSPAETGGHPLTNPRESEKEVVQVLDKESTRATEQLFVSDFQSRRFRIDVHREEGIQMALSKAQKATIGCSIAMKTIENSRSKESQKEKTKTSLMSAKGESSRRHKRVGRIGVKSNSLPRKLANKKYRSSHTKNNYNVMEERARKPIFDTKL
ncbi:DgyrCDS12273 [Dimorphilus gyrociliatus]|uniref:DgyrCDS12273 n=1 Tax=Dimorphilus gyrociliatus TaxID=2664684 RepID=A0A7I8W5Y3_9ANNE|nr:DgyrCDS12273 [Dimorphilus gyrociliatus]